MVRELFRNLDNIFTLSITEFKSNINNSLLGVFWHLLNPILLFTLLLLVFRDRLGLFIPNYEVYLLIGIIFFNFFQISTYEATNITKNNRFLLKSINLSLRKLVFSIVLKNSFFFIIEMFLIFLISIYFNIFSISGALIFIFVFFLYFIFTFSVSLLLTLMSSITRDFHFIWKFGLNLLFFATPLFYSIDGQTRLGILNLFNPLYHFIMFARSSIIDLPNFNVIGLIILYLVCLSFLVFCLMLSSLFSKKVIERL